MTVSEWISVKDKLPDGSNQHIICLINNEPIACIVHDADICLSLDLSFHWPTKKWIKDKYYAKVTHWMPLPKPPKE